MARPNKQGLDYFPLNIDFFEDIKVRRIKKDCGPSSISILTCLLCNIYRDYGYYMCWNEDMTFVIAETTGVTEGAVSEVIRKALHVGFFDKSMFDNYGILTSRGIQGRFLLVVRSSKLKRDPIISKYQIFESSEESGINTEEIKESSEETAETSEESTQRKEKKRKEEKERKRARFQEFWNSYHKITGLAKTDLESALKYWEKLTQAEECKAVDCIQLYFSSLKDTSYCKKARTYLADKNFNDEFSLAIQQQQGLGGIAR